MPSYAPDHITLKTHLLTAPGTPYGGQQPELLVIQREPGGMLVDREDEYNASGFDIAALRQSFADRTDAENLLGAFRSGRATINYFRGIDPGEIRAREMIFDVHAVDLDDGERETLTILGALDTLSRSERATVIAAFPILEAIRIPSLAEPARQLAGDGVAKVEHGCFVRVCGPLREIFDRYASPDGGTPAAGRLDAETMFRRLYPGSYYDGSLQGVAEDAGKTLMNLRAGNFDSHGTEILRMRLYDPADLRAPELRPVIAPSVEDRAIAILSGAEPAAARAIMDAVQARRAQAAPRQDVLRPRNDFKLG